LAKLDAELSCHACQFKLENVSRTGSVQWKNLTVFLAISGILRDVLSRAKNSGRQCHFKIWLDCHKLKKIPA
jgi:hypothetical protein